MEFICQKAAVAELESLASANRHSVLIEGPQGCGKSYLAKQYAKMLQVDDFQIVTPKVDVIKETVDACLQLNTPIVLCIENLDLGVPAASYALLKFLEEPSANVYIVVTCRNIQNVPDTIISRSAVVVTAPPVDIDVSAYSLNKDAETFKSIQLHPLWRCVRTFTDADTVLNMNSAQIEYFSQLNTMVGFRDSVSNIVWKLSHYNDNTDAPVELVIRYLMDLVGTPHIRQAGISCMRDISQGRIASHAALTKFAFELKYCE